MRWPKWLLTLLHIETLFIIGMICIAIYYFFFYRGSRTGVEKLEEVAQQIFQPFERTRRSRRARAARRKNKSEERCREIFENIYRTRFRSVRPDWLKNPATGKNLELDGFAPDVKTPLGRGLAFEYDGQQHAQYTPHFHTKGPDEFLYQTKKDSWKDLRCKQQKVMLVRIPHFVAYIDLERYIKSKLGRLGVLPREN